MSLPLPSAPALSTVTGGGAVGVAAAAGPATARPVPASAAGIAPARRGRCGFAGAVTAGAPGRAG